MIINRITFHTNISLASFPAPVCLERETQYTPAYHNSSKIFNGLFVYTEKGRGCFKEARRQWDLLPGAAYACSGFEPGVSYFYPPDGNEPWTFWWLRFKGEYAETMLKDLINHYGHIYHIPPEHPVIRRLSDRLESGDGDQFISLQEGSSMVFGVVNMLAEVYSRKYHNRPQSRMILKAKKLILEHLDKNISCHELAAGLGISREHLSRQFKQETGMSPLEFIIRCKMNEACGMLKESAMSCKEIAFKSGYDNTSNFIRAFKKYQKMTPVEFRKQGALPRF